MGCLFCQGSRSCLQDVAYLLQCLFQILIVIQYAVPGQCFNPAHTGCNTVLSENLEAANHTGICHMCTTAEFHREIAHSDNSYLLAVLLTEKCHGAGFLCFLNIHNLRNNRNVFIDKLLYPVKFLCCHRSKVAEVETKSFSVHIGTGLLYMGAENLSQCLL